MWQPLNILILKNVHSESWLKLDDNWEHYKITSQFVAPHSLTNSKQELIVDNSNFLFTNCSVLKDIDSWQKQKKYLIIQHFLPRRSSEYGRLTTIKRNPKFLGCLQTPRIDLGGFSSFVTPTNGTNGQITITKMKNLNHLKRTRADFSIFSIWEGCSWNRVVTRMSCDNHYIFLFKFIKL